MLRREYAATFTGVDGRRLVAVVLGLVDDQAFGLAQHAASALTERGQLARALLGRHAGSLSEAAGSIDLSAGHWNFPTKTSVVD
jgi:hypothetical protein